MCSLDEYEEMNGAEKNKEKKGKSKEQLKKNEIYFSVFNINYLGIKFR